MLLCCQERSWPGAGGWAAMPPSWPPNTHRTRPHEDPGNQPLGVLPPHVTSEASVLPQGVARIPKDRQTHTHTEPLQLRRASGPSGKGSGRPPPSHDWEPTTGGPCRPSL